MKLRALYDAKIIAYNNYQKLLEQLCCVRYNENCLSRRCLLCKNRLPKYKEFNDKRIIKYKMWVQERQEIIDLKTKKPKIVTKHLKMVYNGHPRQIISQLHTDLEKFFVHQRNIIHQYSAINHLKQNLQDDDVLIHIDFSENYYTKYAEEIQAFHFGGSRAQLSLHTVVVYLKGTIHSYCTISDNIAHSPAAIWVHLGPRTHFSITSMWHKACTFLERWPRYAIP
ncbi:unnamed protein product [Acanthoscelides obtectus]|uniref:Uncharacterized protein n=1 Tax=Acanthoscelides obtectus TaxID=200917 RepID=A0A9P0JQD1_ACAOB|nr:unnamed protein product [Acanthoscelides obtectus]CAK1663832.1 hypothetical protein AOBTE_LOCUS23878 [Acanthoscelides obtectus]